MAEYRLTEAEENLADIIWANEPIRSSELVKICEEKFNWKKSTTYTMLKRLEKKKIVQNKNSIVEALIKKEDYFAEQSKMFIEENFDGSLPRFLAAFTRRKKLSKNEIKELQKLINEHREEMR
ncbi:MAG: BlaI/MecI/CopY family transcriptional regulator [Tissierellia bacterium]|nr:BlaI/MecI/CopY family transcriptional regulator [Tissierellia bacterium]